MMPDVAAAGICYRRVDPNAFRQFIGLDTQDALPVK